MRGAPLVRSRAVLVGACLALMGLAGCTNRTAANASVTISGSTLTVFASQPPSGSAGQVAVDMLNSERLALRQNGAKVGKFTVKLVDLNGRELSANARAAVETQSAIAYLGELQPGTSQISVEILNQQGILEVSPADTAVFLTQPTPAVPGAPETFFPARSTYHETFARVVPNSGREANAQVREMQTLGVTKLYVASDGQPYGAAIALEVAQAAHAAGLSVSQGPATVAGAKGSGANAVFYGATVNSPGASKSAAALLDGVSSSLPSVKLFAPSGLYDPALVAGLGAATQKSLYVSAPGYLPSDMTPGAKQFVSQFKAAYGHDPVPQAIFAYEGMAATLAVLNQAGAAANSRSTVVADFRSLKNRQSPVLGTYSINGGDTSIAPFVIARATGGALTPFKSVQG